MADRSAERLIDLSHVIEEGMTTYKGLPGPHICDFWDARSFGRNYDDGSTFQIGRIDMVANTGTYVDSPFHRYADGAICRSCRWIAGRPRWAGRSPTVREGLAVDADAFAGLDVARQGGAGPHRLGPVLAHRRLFRDHPFLTGGAAQTGRGRRAFVGIDSHNIDDTRARARPVHTVLLGAGISRSASI